MTEPQSKEQDLKLFEQAVFNKEEERRLISGYDDKEILKNMKAKQNTLRGLKESYDFQWNVYVDKCHYLDDKYKRLLGSFLKTEYFKFLVLEAFKDVVAVRVVHNGNVYAVGTSEVLKVVELKLKELSYCPSDFEINYDKKFQKRVVDIIRVFSIEEEEGYFMGYKIATRPEGYGIWEHIEVILTEIDN